MNNPIGNPIGMSEIIATILMMMITIGMAGIAMSYFIDRLGDQPKYDVEMCQAVCQEFGYRYLSKISLPDRCVCIDEIQCHTIKDVMFCENRYVDLNVTEVVE